MCGGFWSTQRPRAVLKTNKQPQEHDVGGKTSETPLSKTRTARAAAEAKIAALVATREAELAGDGDVSKIDSIDQAIAAERRAITILDQRLVALARGERKQARLDREADRIAALKVIVPMLDKRVAAATELDQTIKRVVELYEQINDSKQLRAAWPFATPEHFPWQVYDLGAEILRAVRDNGGYNLLPGAARQAIAQGGSGFTQAPSNAPRAPDDLPGKIAANAAHIVKALGTLNIHPAEPEADSDAAAA
jgi:hypothetical protein